MQRKPLFASSQKINLKAAHTQKYTHRATHVDKCSLCIPTSWQGSDCLVFQTQSVLSAVLSHQSYFSEKHKRVESNCVCLGSLPFGKQIFFFSLCVFGFKVLHACVVVAVEQCRKCVRMRVYFILPVKQRVRLPHSVIRAMCMSGQA